LNTILFYNVKANGQPRWNLKSDHEKQPHIEEIAAILVDEESQDIIQSINLVVKPDNWDISEDSPYTTEEHVEMGVPEGFAIMMLYLMWNNTKRVTFDKGLNQKLIKTAIARYLQDEPLNLWNSKKNHPCLKAITKKVTGISKPLFNDSTKHFLDRSYNRFDSDLYTSLILMRNMYFKAME